MFALRMAIGRYNHGFTCPAGTVSFRTGLRCGFGLESKHSVGKQQPKQFETWKFALSLQSLGQALQPPSARLHVVRLTNRFRGWPKPTPSQVTLAPQ